MLQNSRKKTIYTTFGSHVRKNETAGKISEDTCAVTHISIDSRNPSGDSFASRIINTVLIFLHAAITSSSGRRGDRAADMKLEDAGRDNVKQSRHCTLPRPHPIKDRSMRDSVTNTDKDFRFGLPG